MIRILRAAFTSDQIDDLAGVGLDFIHPRCRFHLKQSLSSLRPSVAVRQPLQDIHKEFKSKPFVLLRNLTNYIRRVLWQFDRQLYEP